MKTIAFFVLLLFSEVSLAELDGTTITDITKPTDKKGKVGSVSISFTVDPIKLANNDIIILSTSTGVAGDPQNVVKGLTATPYTADFTFVEPNTYKIFAKRGTANPILQADASIEISGLAANFVTKVEATTPKAGENTTFTFTLKDGGLLKDDKLYLSNTTTTTVSPTDKFVTLGKDETGATLAKDFNLDSKGSYSVFLTRGSDTSKQIAPAIAVTSSGFITIAFALFFGLFLF